MPKAVSNAELRSFQRSLARFREDMNDRADEMQETLGDLLERSGKSEKPPKGAPKGKSKADDEDEDGGEDDEDDDEWP